MFQSAHCANERLALADLLDEGRRVSSRWQAGDDLDAGHIEAHGLHFGQLGHRRVGNVHVAGDAKVGEEDCAIRGEKEVAGLEVALLSADGASHVHDNAHAHAWDSHG